jgi:ABC transporter DrrB family efflux protein
MTATSLSVPATRRRPAFIWEIVDAVTIAKRNLRTIRRNPDLLLDVTLQPIVFVLVFGVVFGGAIQGAVGGNYMNFLMAGIFVQSSILAAMTTATGLAEDLQKGLMDRFRSLPMGRSSVMVGRALSDLVRSLLAIAVMVVVGLLIGFSPSGSVLDWTIGLGLLLLFTFAASWIAVAIAMFLWRNPTAVQGLLFVLILPLTFASGAFVPTETLPSWLQAFAANQPVSQLVTALRAYTLGQPAGSATLVVVAWSVALIAIGIPLSAWMYRRMARE